MYVGWNVRGVKLTWGETYVGWNVRGVKLTWGETYVGWNVRGVKRTWGETYVGWNVRGVKCPGVKCLRGEMSCNPHGPTPWRWLKSWLWNLESINQRCLNTSNWILHNYWARIKFLPWSPTVEQLRYVVDEYVVNESMSRVTQHNSLPQCSLSDPFSHEKISDSQQLPTVSL